MALVFEKPEVRLPVKVERHADLPGTRKHLRVLDRRLVRHGAGVGARVTFDHVQRLAVEIAGAVEPRLPVEVGDVHDQRVAVPPANGVAVPEVEAIDVCLSVQVDGAIVVDVLVENHHGLRRLDDLKRKRQIREARHTGLEALGQRIGGRAVLKFSRRLASADGWYGIMSVRRIHDDAQPRRNAQVAACGSIFQAVDVLRTCQIPCRSGCPLAVRGGV